MTRFCCLQEVFGQGYSASYRWFRFREFVGFPSYAKEDREYRNYLARLFVVGGTIS